MVTIEQKLSLFSKLLHRTMTEKFTEDMEALKKEYEVKIHKNKEAVDKETEEILYKSLKKAETEKTELVSRARIGMKRKYMSVKDKYCSILMSHIKAEIDKFIQSERYEAYLVTLARQLLEQEQLSGRMIIYMKGCDLEKYGETIRQELLKNRQWELSFQAGDDNMIGGLIAEDPVGHIRLDLSVEALLEDNRPYIMQVLFQAIEAGEADGI